MAVGARRAVAGLVLATAVGLGSAATAATATGVAAVTEVVAVPEAAAIPKAATVPGIAPVTENAAVTAAAPVTEAAALTEHNEARTEAAPPTPPKPPTFSTPPNPPADDPGDAMSAVRREAEDLTSYRVGTVRFRLTWPLQVAGAAGVIVGKRPASWQCATVCEFRGFHAQGEIGLGGAQLAAGWASIVGDTTRSSRWIASVYSGYAVRGALMRTGGTSTLTPEWQTFAGIEGTLAVTRCSISLAVYHRVSDTPSNDPWLIGAGLGWGF